jgi:vitellogenic carboxypeptidase-like protein
MYNGNLDLILGPALNEKFLRTLNWSLQSEYLKAPKKLWTAENSPDISGYVRSVGNFRQVVMRNAGHMVPLDQPIWALDMITRFVDNKPF